MTRNGVAVADQKKIVLFAANTYWYLYNFRLGTLKAFINDGYSVFCVASSCSQGFDEKIVEIGCRVENVFLEQKSKNIFKESASVLSFINLLRRVRPAAVYTFTPKCNLYLSIAGRILGIDVVVNIAGMGKVFVRKTWLTIVVESMYRIGLKANKRVYFQNKHDLQEFVQRRLVGEGKSFLLPGSGVDLVRFSSEPIPVTRSIRFLLCSRLISEKGVRLYCQAASELKQKYGDSVEFFLAGLFEINPDESAITREEVSEWESRRAIKFLGGYSDVREAIRLVHCVVLPTYYREGTPKILLESAAMGRVIVTTNTPGCSDVVEHAVNGFLCDKNSLSSLVECLDKVIQLSGESLAKMGEKGRTKMVTEYDENIVISEYISSIKVLLGSADV